MKLGAFLLSFSVLVHLFVVDFVYYFLGTSISVNFIAILSYNIVWLIIAVMIGNRIHNERKS